MTSNNVRLVLTMLLILSISISPLESIFLHVARAANNPSPGVGLVAWTNVGGSIDLTQAKKLFKTISSETVDAIEGTYTIYINNYNTEDISLYIGSGGLIATYYADYEPASKIILWNNDKLFYSKLAEIMTIGKSLGYIIDAKNINYYDYNYPSANRYIIVAKSIGESTIGNFDYGSLNFKIPSQATIYEVSFSLYLNDVYNTQPATTVAIDGVIKDSISGNGVVYNSYKGYIPTDVDHILGVMSHVGAQSAAVMIILYNDGGQNRGVISISNADWYFTDSLIPPVLKKTTSTYATVPNPTPFPTPRETIVMPVPVPITQSTKRYPGSTVSESTPGQTQNTPRKPPKVSVDLHGERTNIELGQQSLLKGSIVSFNTNREKMHAQVIIIPPSGVSVVAADFVKSPAGQYTSDFELDPGKGKDIEVTIIPNEVGEFKVISKITYYFGDNKDDNGYEEAKLDIKAGKKGSGGNPQTSGGVEYTTPVTGGQQGNIPTSPGFEIIFSMGTLITYCIYSKVMYSRKKK